MNALLKNDTDISSHYWMLWIAPSSAEMSKIKALPDDQQQKVLMLHPKNPEQLYTALEAAINSDLYQSITLNRSLMPVHQHRLLELAALKHHTHINWLSQGSRLNSASQLSLI